MRAKSLHQPTRVPAFQGLLTCRPVGLRPLKKLSRGHVRLAWCLRVLSPTWLLTPLFCGLDSRRALATSGGEFSTSRTSYAGVWAGRASFVSTVPRCSAVAGVWGCKRCVPRCQWWHLCSYANATEAVRLSVSLDLFGIVAI